MQKKTFGQTSALKQHQFTHHLNELKDKIETFKCKVCEQLFLRKGSLAIHMFSKHKIKGFKCSICSKGFKNSKELQEHQRMPHQFNKVKTPSIELIDPIKIN